MKLDFAIITAANDERVLNDNLLASPLIRSGVAPVIVERGHLSAGSAYNAGMAQLDTEYVVFAHQDVYLPSGWEHNLETALLDLNKATPPCGVLGVWGITDDGTGVGRVWCTGGNREYIGRKGVHEVSSIDEIIIVLRREHNLRFDEALPGFHLYATDIAQQAKSAGLGIHACTAPVIHNSRVNPQVFDATYFAAYRYMQRKWSERLPLQTCVVPVTRSGMPLYRAWLRREWRRRRHKLTTGNRGVDARTMAERLGYVTSPA